MTLLTYISIIAVILSLAPLYYIWVLSRAAPLFVLSSITIINFCAVVVSINQKEYAATVIWMICLLLSIRNVVKTYDW